MKDKIVKSVLRPRSFKSNKGDYGHALLIAGSEKYRGAALLCLKTALYGGAGYVDLAYDGNIDYLISAVPEVIFTQRSTLLNSSLNSFSAILFGNGLDFPDKANQQLFTYLMNNYSKAMIVDATGLLYLREYYKTNTDIAVSPRLIITPHIKEFATLVNAPLVDSNPLTYEKYIDLYLHEHPRTTVVLKSYNTLLKSTDNRYLFAHPNPGLAKAGSGDSLAGLLASLLAYCRAKDIDIAYTACSLMSAAGQKTRKKISSASFTSSKVAEELPYILKEYIA